MSGKISIVVPVYNVEKHLNQCIESILLQTYGDIELVLVDDGSTDSSGAICDKYAQTDARVKVVHKPNGGVSSARNTGIKESTGKYLQFVDSDDYIDPHMCEKLIEAYTGTTDLVVCGWLHYFSDGRTGNHVYIDSVHAETLSERTHLIDTMMEKQLLFSLWNKLFIRERITFEFDTAISLGEDIIFNFEYLENTNSINVISDCLYYYRLDSENSLHTKTGSVYFEMHKSIYDRCSRIALKKFDPAYDTMQSLHLNYIQSVYRDVILQCFHEYTDKKQLYKRLDTIIGDSLTCYALKHVKLRSNRSKINWFLLKHRQYALFKKIAKI